MMKCRLCNKDIEPAVRILGDCRAAAEFHQRVHERRLLRNSMMLFRLLITRDLVKDPEYVKSIKNTLDEFTTITGSLFETKED